MKHSVTLHTLGGWGGGYCVGPTTVFTKSQTPYFHFAAGHSPLWAHSLQVI